MHPVDALQEIAFWLERDLAPSFKVQAFRTAAAAIAGRSDDDLEARLRSGALARTKGVGSRSLEVIGQALEGRVPDYLQALLDRERETTSEAGAGLLADLRGDLHCHSEWSDGGTPIALMVEAARTLGREYIALTDHSPNLTVAHGLTAERLTEQLGVLDDVRADHPDVRVLSGIEVDILEDGTLDQTPAMLDRLDVVVASVHSKLRADRRTMTERMLGGIRDPHTNVLGHCTGRLVQGPAASARSRRSTRVRCSRRAWSTTSRSRSTADPSDRTRRTTSSSSRSRWAACSASTPTHTRPDSSTSCGSGRSGRRRTGCRRTAS